MENSGQYGQNINNFGTQPQPVMYPNQMQSQMQGGYIPARPTANGQNGQKADKKDYSGIIKTVCLIFTSLLAVTFIGLFIYMTVQKNEAETDVEGKIELAVAEAETALETKLEKEFEEKEKYPYKTFAGPSDFGSLTFEYPKTWSVYLPDDGSRANDFKSYFNPGQVNIVQDETVMALRVSIVNQLTEEVKQDFADKVEGGEMTVSTTIVNGNNVDVYAGELDSRLMGIVCVFKIRDKTAIIQTDAMLFKEDFYRVLETIRFNA